MPKENIHDINSDSLRAVYISLLKNPLIWENNLQTALKLVATQCSKALGVARSSIWQKMRNDDALHCTVLCEADICIVNPDQNFLQTEHKNYFKAFETERVIATSNVVTDLRTLSFARHYFLPEDVHSSLDATLHEEGHPTGIVRFEHRGSTREWLEEEKNFAVSIADLLSQIIIFHSLRGSEDRYRKVFNSASDAIIVMRDFKMVDCNSVTLTLLDCTEEEIRSCSQTRFFPEVQSCGARSEKQAQTYFKRAFNDGFVRFEWQLLTWNNKRFDAEISITHLDLDNQPHFVMGIRDITDSKVAYEKNLELASLQQAIFDGASYSIVATDEHGIIHTFNKAAEKLLGYSADDIIGTKTPEIFHDPQEALWRARDLSQKLGKTVDSNFDAFVANARLGEVEEFECHYVSKESKQIPVLMSVSALRDKHDGISGFLCIASDISERKRANEQLLDSKREIERRANNDHLTGLPNRSRLHDVARVAIQSAKSHNRGIALMLLDLNRFKDVNDTLGHAAGDKLLQAIAMRLRKLLALHGAYLYRLGGDEFAILLSKVNSRQEVDDTVQLISDGVRKPIVVDEITLELGGSIGIAMYPEHGDNSHALLRCADVAMYKAKASNRGSLVYETQFDSHSPRRLTLMSELGSAIREEQLVLHYQPRVNIQQKTCVGCEALVRWQHPKFGLVPPGEFIPFAEMSDFIQPLGIWVLKTAVKQIKAWLDQGFELTVSINLSARNLMDITISDHIDRTLKKHAVPPHLLEIEITESALITDPERALKTINHIHSLGVRFAIDDFGTGYSSLSYLKRLPIDTLKIDRAFVADMLTDEQDAVIVRSTISLAHSFDLQVVAEGVEDDATLAALQVLKCEQAQGFLISKPKPIEAFEAWFKDY